MKRITVMVICFILISTCFVFADTEEIDTTQSPILSGVCLSWNANAHYNIKDRITLDNAWGKTIKLQMKSKITGNWLTKAVYKTQNIKKDSLTVTYPTSWKKTTSSTWRLYVTKTETTNEVVSKTISVTARNRINVSTTARSVVIINSSGKVIYSKNSNVKRANASTTKIMTAIVAMKKLKLSDTTSISSKAVHTGWANLNMKVGDKYKIKSLFYGMLISSSNDASVVIAERVSGSTKNFAVLMNQTAKKIGCKNTHFVNPNGIDSGNHYSTAYDVGVMLRYAYNHSGAFRSATRTKYYTVKNLSGTRKIGVRNTNELLGKYSGLISAKTGTSTKAGNCFASVYRYKNKNYYVVVLHSKTNYSRYSDSKKLYTYIRNYGSK